MNYTKKSNNRNNNKIIIEIKVDTIFKALYLLISLI